MKRKDRVRKLQEQRDALNTALEQLDLAHHSGMLNKHQYLEKKRELLNWKLEEEVYNEMQTPPRIGSNKTMLPAAAMAIFAVIMIFSFTTGGITSLVIFDEATVETYTIDQRFSENGTINQTNITASTLRVDGKIFGYGEAWIYLVDGEDRKLVYYADTAGQALTGFVVAGTPVEEIPEINDTNSTNETLPEEVPDEPVVEEPVVPEEVLDTNETGNETINETEDPVPDTNETINETVDPVEVNDTNVTINDSVEIDRNVTLNETPDANQTDPMDINATVNETGPVNDTNVSEPIMPEIIISSDTYAMGAYVNINIVPADAVYTLYVHTPTNTYLLDDDYWVASELGEHELVALVSTVDSSERITATFNVENVEQATATFTQACVDTCDLPDSPVYLEIVVRDVELQIDSITYAGEVINDTNETNVTKPEVSKKPDKAPKNKNEEKRTCLAENPNFRPKDCFTSEIEKEFFPDRDFTLVNELGMRMAVVDGQGNMHIRGVLADGTGLEPQEYDLVVKGTGGSSAWIDALSGNLYILGTVYGNQETLMWRTRQDYVISNEAGMYLAIFDAQGDLYLRGIVIEGTLT